MNAVESAELSVIGSVLLSSGRVLDELDLNPADFASPQLEHIYRVMAGMKQAGTPVDLVTVSSALLSGEMKINPGLLHEATATTPTEANAEYYAEQVAKAATLRRLKAAAAKIAHIADMGGDEEELVELARKEIDATAGTQKNSAVRFFGESIDDTLWKLDEEVDYAPTPWPSLNEIIGGLRPGAVYVVGARPSVGKSVVALQLARSMAERGSVAFVSLEMSTDDVNIRAVAQDLHIDIKRLMERNLTPGDWNKIRDRRASWNSVPLAISDEAIASITDIKRFVRSVHRRKPLAGVVLDYLQLMAQQPGDKRSRQEFVSDMSRQMKILAMEMNVPVVLLSQLNRGSEQGETRPPRLSDLRESGSIEQDADVVILLHREIMGPNRGDIAMLVAKNRHGSTNVANLAFYGHYSEIREQGDIPQHGNIVPPAYRSVAA